MNICGGHLNWTSVKTLVKDVTKLEKAKQFFLLLFIFIFFIIRQVVEFFHQRLT